MFPGQSGKTVATFIRSRTTAAAEIDVDAERRHHRPDGEQLDQPAGRLEHGSQCRGLRLAQYVKPALGHRQKPPDRQRALRERAQLAARHQDRGEEERDPDDGDELEARNRPVRDPRRREHERGQKQSRNQVEEAVRENGPEQPACRPLAPRRPPGEDADAGKLADPPREHRVGKQADRERREDVRERRLLRARHRLADHDVPRDRAHKHRREVQDERNADPAPGDGLEGVADEAPVGAAPPQQ